MLSKFCSNLSFIIQDINLNTDYQSFKNKWGNDQRFVALERKEREMLLNERYSFKQCPMILIFLHEL